MFPTHTEIGWTLIVAAVLTSLLAEMNHRWPGPLEAIAGRFRPQRHAGEADFLSLHDAALEFYEANLNTKLGIDARGYTKGQDALLEWLCYWMMDRGLVIYGHRPPSRMVEQVPLERLRGYGLVEGGRRLDRDGFETYEDLVVKRHEFRAMIPMFSDTDRRGGILDH